MSATEAAVGDPLAAAAYDAYKLVRGRKFAEAVQAYDNLLCDVPARADLWVNRGVALQALYRLDDALESFSKALSHRPDDAGALINRGAVLGWLGRYNEALMAYSLALDIESDNEAGLLGRSVILGSLRRFPEAMADTEKVLSVNPGHGGAHYNKSLILLSQGNYVEGFREHEWRFGTNAVLGKHRFKAPMWHGEKTDKVILVHCEQGLGDNIQFFRYLEKMKGLNIIVEAPKQLVRLFTESCPFKVIPRDEVLPFFHLHCPMMSLGAIAGTTLDTVPADMPYLKVSDALISHWANVFSELQSPKAGIAWSSGVRLEQPIAVAMQRRKSVPKRDIELLLNNANVAMISLQKEEPWDGWPEGNYYNPMGFVNDLADTAAIIKNLDLVITVDSAVAHLAGALGKPVWVLNRYDICWRWLSGDRKGPWYPTAKMYRQSQPMEWNDVVTDVKRDLEAL